MKVFAPGKLILSGEHAVVHGHPALAMAVNRYVIATAFPEESKLISFDLSDLAYERKLTLCALEQLKNRIKEKYQRFINGDFKIRDVLQKPVELAQFAFSLFFETLNIKLNQGLKIHLQSDIPMGCGMGSSAATILSVVHAIANHLRIELSSETFFQLGLEAENVQHGFSSGLDLRVSLHGGCLFTNNGQIYTRDVPSVPMFLVNTGIPDCGTGECVEKAARYFKESQIGHEFAAVTQAMDCALQQNNYSATVAAVQANHKLLMQIGVVPELVQQVVNEIEKTDSAAKICGAGAVTGQKAGVLLVVTKNKKALEEICERYHYEILPISGEPRGVHVV